MSKFRRTFRLASSLAVVIAAGLALASCGNGGDVDNDLAFRVIHASPDSPPVNILMDGTAIRSGADYKSGTGFIFVTPRTYRFGIEAVLAGDDVLIIDEDIPLAAGKEYTLIAIGKDATDTVEPLVIENAIEEIPDGNTRLQIVHAAPDVPTVDIYLTGAGASLPAATPIDQVTYGNDPAPRQLVPPGTYVVRVTPAGDPNTVLFDSGEIVLRNRDDLLLVAVNNTAAGASPISLVANDRFNTVELLDKNSRSDVRVVHVSPDSPAFNVIGDPATSTSPEVPFASGLTYLGATSYVSTLADTYSIRGVKTSDPTPTTAPFTVARALFGGQRSTIFIAGLLASVTGLAVTDDIRPVYAVGKLRIFHAAPATATLDVYVVETGTDIATVDPTLRNLVLSSITGHLGFEPKNYTITFTKAGTKEVVASQAVAATAGTVQTVILVDQQRVTGDTDGLPAGVLVLDDLAS